MKPAIGLLASELQSDYPRGVTRVARAYAEELARRDEFELVCLVERLADQFEPTYAACDLRAWLAAHPVRRSRGSGRSPAAIRLAKGLVKGAGRSCLPPVLYETLVAAYRGTRGLVRRLRFGRGSPAMPAAASLRTLRELDAVAIFDPLSEVWHLPLENEPGLVVGWFHDAIRLRIHEGPHWRPDAFCAAVSRLTCKAQQIVCGSASAEHDLVAYFPGSAGKTRVIHDGHDLERFGAPLGPDALALARAKHRLDPAAPYFIAVGPIEPRKNTINILRACRFLKEMGLRRSQLLLVGEDGAGHYDERVVSDLCRPIDVVRRGYAEDADLPALVAGSCALLYPSLWEGFGIPPLEAMSAGTLVVASDVASLPEVLGEHPLYCDPYDPRSIASAMHRCLQMPAEERAARIEQARRHAARYTWRAAAHGFVALLRERLAESFEVAAPVYSTRAA